MATTLVGLSLIATTLIVLALLTWATIYYVPAVLTPEDHEVDEPALDHEADEPALESHAD